MDIPKFKRTNLLTLRSVYPADFATVEVIYNKVPEIEKVKPEPVAVYTEMPKKFTSVDSWPTFSNLKCWSCDQLPTSYPKFIPTNPEQDVNGNDICDPDGHFCEWNCAVRYVEKEYPKEQQSDAHKLICIFESKFSRRKREKILSAPSKTLMKAYCGKNGITPSQYREKIAQINSEYDLSNYKLSDFTVTE
ncbi:Putative VV VLTF2-like transcription factor [Pacmanvirus A23]|uniref:Putative VV VLTF2-like transcription factor n=1 Tax=Pacmanvirus A23 TaxID=1932881 RepID=UPI000A091AC4|nr:Putative VV VLTF2-like transcription factor [Pacmanvirus A23]SIP85951.1 Putative VV VLTF2-like transcription factor [Pacmanvirus A23]